ncbi:MAG: site-specific DNA-methyltransferase, partial [Treponema sp.]|nr:site-specific DNA-methyltransferase [Treponema sp.]
MPSWFIKLFTQENDTVMDPFMGSGTTVFAAQKLRRNSIGIEILKDYCSAVKRSSKEVEL